MDCLIITALGKINGGKKKEEDFIEIADLQHPKQVNFWLPYDFNQEVCFIFHIYFSLSVSYIRIKPSLEKRI